VDNLFVSDASVLPTALGVNPQLTIMALSMRCAGFIDERLSGKSAVEELMEQVAGAPLEPSV